MHEESNMIENNDPAPAPPVFQIDSAEKANWLIRRLVECRTYAERARAFSERECRRAEREEQMLMARFARQLEEWLAEELRRRGGRRKSLALPAGTVGIRRVGPKLVIENKEAVLRWAKTHVPDAVVVTERLLKSRLNEVMEATGLIPEEGAHVEPSQERLFVR